MYLDLNYFSHPSTFSSIFFIFTYLSISVILLYFPETYFSFDCFINCLKFSKKYGKSIFLGNNSYCFILFSIVSFFCLFPTLLILFLLFLVLLVLLFYSFILFLVFFITISYSSITAPRLSIGFSIPSVFAI